MLTIVIPVGPRPEHQEHLQEAIDSVWPQMSGCDELIIIDDMANLEVGAYRGMTSLHRNRWHLGGALSFNIGVGLAKNEHIVFLSSDDRLEPTCLRYVRAIIDKEQHPNAYYWMDVVYSDGFAQSLPCGAACVTKQLWYWSGGFPIETTVGMCDLVFISMLCAKGHGKLIRRVPSPEPIYWHRRHHNRQTLFTAAAASVQDMLSHHWEPSHFVRVDRLHV